MRKRKLVSSIIISLVLTTIVISVSLFALFRYHKSAVEIIIGRAFGAAVEIDSVSIDPKNKVLHITGFKLHNPKGFFEEDVLAYVPKITGKYDPKSLLVNNRVHFTSLNIYVKAMVIIKGKNGKLNVDQLAIFKDGLEKFPLQADRIILTADYAVSKDLSRNELPHIEVFDVNIRSAEYEGFPTTKDITAKIASEIMRRTTMKGAELVGAAIVAGAVGGWPVLIPAETIVVLSGKDSYQATFNAHYEDAYTASLEAAHELGRKVYGYKDKGVIKGYIDDADVAIEIRKKGDDKADVIVSARKHLIPKPNIAGGILYEIAHKLWMKKKKLI